MVQIGNTLVHGAPRHAVLPVPLPLAADAELVRVVNQGLLAEEALLVLVGPPGSLGDRLAVGNQIVRMPFQKLSSGGP